MLLPSLSNYFYIFKGMFLTLFITIICLFFGVIIGFFCGVRIFFKKKIISTLINFYKKFFINTPLMTQLFLVFFALPISINGFIAGLLVLTLNSGAHITVIVLEALENINQNQWDTSISLGFRHFEALKKIFIKHIFISNKKLFFNEFIQLIKESSLLSVFGIREVCFRSKEIALQEYNFLPYMLFVSFIYFCIISIFEKLYMKYMNKNS